MDAKNIAAKLIKKYKTNDPFLLAENVGILVNYEQLLPETLGFFSNKFRIKIIHINDSIHYELAKFVCAHELGHALMHPHVNTPFLFNNTFLSVAKIEREANIFGVELIIPDAELNDIDDCTVGNLSRIYSVPEDIIRLKFL
ncbi:ImmA/IrrE family metallo-endopeptidase [Pectinatus frisingensis]|uniref:ImmA/IrrE family metallo-endopeptidase n=1 Tax=Pectinatus frisingensis TaxID=865 RepID=UPI003D8093B0